ncbi:MULTISPECIES: glycosyltransferase family 2 protein [unclassified Agrococcus]|uniref:glycosyltransferase family 2 protein n=1 Tax=unclassified Agrococcus TaxID=2615065 RepID=UPI00360DBE6E
MTAARRVLIVMPAFNEEEAVGASIADVLRTLPGAGCLVVDDGSRDATVERARAAGALVARLPYNLGVGGAMRVGFRFALEHGYDVVVQIDSDGQHDPAYVPELLARLDDADVVLGARFAGVGDYRTRGPRKWAMSVLSTILSRTAGTRLTDTTSGMRASGPAAVRFFAENYPAEYLGDTIESLTLAARAGLRVVQVPVVMRERQGGVPSHDFWKSTVFLGRAAIALVFAHMRSVSTLAGRP